MPELTEIHKQQVRKIFIGQSFADVNQTTKVEPCPANSKCRAFTKYYFTPDMKLVVKAYYSQEEHTIYLESLNFNIWNADQ